MQPNGCMYLEGAHMFDIKHRIGVEAPPSAVYLQLATTEGLRQWWTTDTRGRSALGDKVGFHFGGPDRFMTMEVVQLEVDRRVAWRCIEGPEEWIDTIISFELKDVDGETIV